MSSLLAEAASLADIRNAEQRRELERQRELRELEAQRQRENRLTLLSNRGEQPWADIADLIATRKPTAYDTSPKPDRLASRRHVLIDGRLAFVDVL